MDRKEIDIKRIINEYLKFFPKNIKVEKVILFGSFARKEPYQDSDIDLIIISPDFKNIDFLKRLELLSCFRKGRLTRSVSMDIIGYTAEEFEDINKESMVIRSAKKEGRIVYKKGI